MFETASLLKYLGAFILLIGAGVGFPIPEELPIVGAGVMVGHASEPPPFPELPPQFGSELLVSPLLPFPANLPWASLSPEGRYEIAPPPPQAPAPIWWIMLPVCILGVVISDGLLYGMGRFWGPRLLEKPWMVRLMPPPKRERIERNFQKYGVLVLLFARMLPAIRSPIFIMAGITRVSFTRFLLADGIYAIPGVSLLFFLAFWFGDQFRELVMRAEAKVMILRPILILAAISAFGAYLVIHFYRRPVAVGDPKELPIIGPQVANKMTCPGNQPPITQGGQWKCPDGSAPSFSAEGSRDRQGGG